MKIGQVVLSQTLESVDHRLGSAGQIKRYAIGFTLIAARDSRTNRTQKIPGRA